MMWHQTTTILIKEGRVLLRDRQALALLFAMPAFFILVMSFALQGVYETGQRDRPIEILVVKEDAGPLTLQAMEDLRKLPGLVFLESVKGEPVTPEKAENLVRKGSYLLTLHFPKGFGDMGKGPERDLPAPRATVYFVNDPATNVQLLASLKGSIQGVILRRVLLAGIPQQIERAMASMAGPLSDGPGPPSPSLREQMGTSLLKSLREDPEGLAVDFVTRPPRGIKEGRLPTSAEQNVPGYTIFGVFFIVLTLSASFIQEKREGTFQRVLAAPLRPTALLIGKILPFYIVNLLQIAVMFGVGVLVFDMHLGSLPALLVVSLALALAANGLGLLVASVGKTEAQVNSWSVFLGITLAALGGMMVPTYIMPEAMKTLSVFTPHAWALSGYHDVIIRGLGVREVLPEAGVLVGFGAAFFLIALGCFRSVNRKGDARLAA